MDEKKDKKVPAKKTNINFIANVNAITRNHMALVPDKASTVNGGSIGTIEKENKVLTGLATRDKERTKKII